MGYGNVTSIGGIKGYKGKLVRYRNVKPAEARTLGRVYFNTQYIIEEDGLLTSFCQE